MRKWDFQKSRREANAFRIWREGKSVKWDCTISELAEATGLYYGTVASICRERGWPVQQGENTGRSEHGGPRDVSRLIGESAGRRSPRVNTWNDPVRRLYEMLEEVDRHEQDQELTAT